MTWFRREGRRYQERSELPRREAYGGAVFILASVFVVLGVASSRFDRLFFVAAAVGTVLFILTRYKLAYLGATTGWMAFRFLLAVVLSREPRALPWAVGLGLVTWLLIYLDARPEMDGHQ